MSWLMLEMNHNSKQILQARELEEGVKRLCSFDRRAVHKIGTEETLHYLSDELAQAQLKMNLHRADTITASQIREGLHKSIAKNSNFSPELIEEMKAKIAVLEPNEALDIVNLFTRIGDPHGKKIILGAHYDMDLFIQKGAGADDNASGVATLLQLAKNLKAHESKFADAGLCIEIVFFGAEEQPFYRIGSKSYAEKLAYSLERQKLELMINLDMVGFFDDKRDLDIYLGDREGDSPFGAFLKNFKKTFPEKENYYVLESYRDKELHSAQLLLACMRGQSLVTEHLSPKRLTFTSGSKIVPQQYCFCPGQSDHDSFRHYYLPALSISDNPYRNRNNYHTDSDTPETLDYQRMSKLTDSLESFLLNLTETNLFKSKP